MMKKSQRAHLSARRAGALMPTIIFLGSNSAAYAHGFAPIPSTPSPHTMSTNPVLNVVQAAHTTHSSSLLKNLHSSNLHHILNQGLVPPVVPPQTIQLDLTSVATNITLTTADLRGEAVAVINVGGTNQSFKAGSKVTSAEFVAIQQRLTGGQKLVINSDGSSSSGSFSLNSLSKELKSDRLTLSELVVPHGVTGTDNFASNSSISISGSLIDDGTIIGKSSNAQTLTGTLSAQNIIIGSGGLLTTSAADSSISSVHSALSLNLIAANSLVNDGTISSAGALSIQTNNLTNSGKIESIFNNVNIGTANPASNLTISNGGGQIIANNGAISIREATYSGTGDTTVSGGDLLSKQLNLNAGQGLTSVNVDQLTGVVNSSGNAAHVQTSTSQLNLGRINLAGDPTFYNDAGSVNIGGNISVGEDLTIIARDNITSSAGVTVNAGDSGQGYNINLIAGANVTSASPANAQSSIGPVSGSPPNTGASSVTFDGASINGGNITLGSGTLISTQSTSANGDHSSGNVLLAAFGGNSGGANAGANGTINWAGSTLLTGGTNGGNNGSVTVIAGGAPAGSSTISTGVVNTTGGSGTGGATTISTAQPITASNNPISYGSNGQAVGGDSLIAGAQSAGNISLGASIQSGGAVNISAGGNIMQAAGSISTPSLTLVTSGGDIGAATANIVTNAGSLNASTSVIAGTGSVFITDINDTGVALSGANVAGYNYGIFFLNETGAVGNITTAPGAAVYGSLTILSTQNGSIGQIPSAGDWSSALQVAGQGTSRILSAPNGNVYVNSAQGTNFVDHIVNGVNYSNTANGDFFVNDNSTMSAGFYWGGGVITANNVLLQSGGNITENFGGGGGIPINLIGPNQTLTVNAAGTALVTAQTAVNLVSQLGVNNVAGNTFDLSTTGAINVQSPISAAVVNLTTTANNASITVGANINASTSATLTANGSGNIITANQVVSTVAVGSNPRSYINPAGTIAYTANFSDGTVSVIDTTTNSVISTITVGSMPEGIAFNQSGTLAYVTNQGSGTVSVIDTTHNTVISTIAVGSSPVGIAVNASGTFAYVANASDNTVSVIDTSSNHVVATVAVGSQPISVSVNPSGSSVYVSNQSSNNVSVINTSTNTVATTIGVGSDPSVVSVDPTGKFVYVTNFNSNTVSIIDAKTNAVVSTVAVGSSPQGLSFNSAGTLAYVINNGDGTTSILNTSTNQIVETVSVGLNPTSFGQFVGLVGQNTVAYVGNSNSNNVSVIRMPSINAPAVSLNSATGDINISTSASTLSATTGGIGNVNLTDSGSVSLNASSAGGTFQLGTPGAITVSDALSANQIVLQTTANNSNITINASVNATTLATLSANGTGNIITPNVVTGQVSTSSSAYGSVLSINGNYAYVVQGASNLVDVIDTRTNTIVQQIAVGAGASGIAIDPSGRYVYTVNNTSSTVTVIDTQTNTRVADINVGVNPAAIAFDPVHPYAYVTNLTTGNVSVISTQTQTVVATIAVGSDPYGVAVTPDGSRVYVANSTSSSVSVIDTQSNMVIATISAGTNPRGIAILPSGTQAYVVNAGDHTVSIIDLRTNTVVQTLSVPDAHGVSINPAGTLAYINGSQNGSVVTVLNTANNKVVDTITTGTNDGAGTFIGYRGNDIVSAISNQYGLSVAIVTQSAISATTLSLSSGSGSIIVLANTANLTANTGGSGDVNITARNSVSLGNSSAGGTFIVGTTGAITTSGLVSGSNVVLQTTSGNIINGGGQVSGNSVQLLSQAGDIGTSGSNIQTVATTVSANTLGNVFVNNVGAVTLGESGAGPSQVFSFTSTGSLTNSAPLSAGTINLQTTGNSANIDVAATITSPNLTLNAGGAITQSNANAQVTTTPGGVITLWSQTGGGSGDIGAANARILIGSTTGANFIMGAQTQGNVFIQSAGSFTFGPGNAGAGASGIFDVQTAVGSNGSITTQGTQLGGTIRLTADGSGTISGSGIEAGTNLQLTTGSGDIGSSSQNISTNATNITINTGGSSYINDTSSGTVTLVGANQAGINGNFYLNALSNVYTGSASSISAGTIALNSQTGEIGAIPSSTNNWSNALQIATPGVTNLTASANSGSVYVQSQNGLNFQNAFNLNTQPNVDLWARVLSGNITDTSGALIAADFHILLVAPGNIGSASTPVVLNTSGNYLTANAGGSVNILASGAVDLGSINGSLNQAGQAYTLTSSLIGTKGGGLGNVTAGTTLTIDANVSSSGSFVSTSGDTLSAPSVVFVSGSAGSVSINSGTAVDATNLVSITTSSLGLTGNVNAGIGQVNVHSISGESILVGGSSTPANTLTITSAMLPKITAGSVAIGDNLNTGALTIGASLNIPAGKPGTTAGVYDLSLAAGGAYIGTGTTIITSRALSVYGGTALNTGIISASRTLSAQTAGNLVVDGSINSNTVINLTATGANSLLTVNTGKAVTAPSINIQTGNLNFIGTVNAGAGQISIYSNAGEAIILGGTTGGTNTLLVSSTSLSHLTAEILNLGDSINDTSLTLGASISFAGTPGTTAGAFNVNLGSAGTYSAASKTITDGTQSTTINAVGAISASSISGTGNTTITSTTGSISLSGALNLTGTNSTIIVASGGAITDSATITAPLVTLSSGSNGAISIANTIGNVGGTTTIIANGSGSITETAGTIRGATVSLSSGSGSIGGVLKVQATGLNVSTTGLANIDDTANTGLTTLGTSSVGGAFTLLTGGALTVNTAITSPQISFTAGTNGNILVDNAIGIATGTTSLIAKGTGTINEATTGSYTVSGGTVNLTIATGSVGNSGALRTAAGNLNVTSSSTGTAVIDNTTDTGNLNLGASSAASMTVATGGNLTTTGAITATTVALTAGLNGNISIGNTLGAVSGITTITASGTGSITETAGTVRGSVVTLTSGTGGLAGTLKAQASTLNINTLGSANIDNTANTSLTTLGASNVGGSFTLSTGAGLTINAVITAPQINFSAGTNGNILIGNSVGIVTGTTSLTSKGTGTINDAGTGSYQLLGNTISLVTATGGVGTTAAFRTQTANLGVTSSSTAAINIDNTAQTSNLNLGASSAGSLTLTTGGQLTVTGAVAGPTITLTAPGIIVGNTIGNTTGTTTLSATGSGNLVDAGSGSYVVRGTTVILQTANGNIGDTNGFRVGATNLNASAGGTVNLNNTATSLVTVANSKSGGNFTINSAGPMTVNNIQTNNGSVLVDSASGALNVNANATIKATNGNVTIEQDNITSGTIVIGANATLYGSSTTAGIGNVNIVIGPVPVNPVIGTTPANVALTKTGGGQIYFGTKGITTASSSSALNALGRNIIFNTGTRAASAIKLSGGDTITADPPTANNTSISTTIANLPIRLESQNIFNEGAAGNSGSATNSNNFSYPVSPTQLLGQLQTQEPLNLPSTNQMISQQSTLQAVLQSSQQLSQSNQTIDSSSRNRLSFDRQTLTFGAYQEASDSEISASVSMDPELESIALESSAKDGDATRLNVLITRSETQQLTKREASLHRGNVLLNPSKNMVLETPFGSVEIAAHSLSFVMVTEQGLAVYDLDDTHGKAVVISAGGHKITLSPGRHVFVTQDCVASFDQVNPAECIGHRGLNSRRLGDGLKAFTSEFSAAHAMLSLKPLRAIINSKNPQAAHVSQHLIKTTAILQTLTASNGAYVPVLRPRLTASK